MADIIKAIADSSKTTRAQLEKLCCSLDKIVASSGNGQAYNTNQIFVTSAGVEFSLFTNVTNVHSVSLSVLGTAGQVADITIDGVTVTLPIGTSLTYEATTVLANDIVVNDTSTAIVVFNTIS